MIEFRQAKAEDMLEIGAVHVTAWRETYRGIIADDYLANLSVVERGKGWHSFLSRDDTAIIVAIAPNQTIVGFLATGFKMIAEKEQPYVIALYLLRAYQQQGIGKQMLAQALLAFKKQQYLDVYVGVLAENDNKGFYEKTGATLCGEQTIELGEQRLVELLYKWQL